jgi:endonuclease YncB( thermonuclease family)
VTSTLRRGLGAAAIVCCLQCGAPAALAASGSNEHINGVPRIVDGDTLELASTKLRLYGIDAPETQQQCLNGNNKRYACGVLSQGRSHLAVQSASAQPCVAELPNGALQLLMRLHCRTVLAGMAMVMPVCCP